MNENTVKIQNGKLVLSLPLAIDPTVWHMHIGAYNAYAFEIKTVAKKYALHIRLESNDPQEIARFAKKADALAIMMQATEILEDAHGTNNTAPKSRKVKNTPTEQPSCKHKKTAIIGIMLLLILAMIFVWGNMVTNHVTINAAAPVDGQQAIQEQNSGTASGVPLSADDFLSAQ